MSDQVCSPKAAACDRRPTRAGATLHNAAARQADQGARSRCLSSGVLPVPMPARPHIRRVARPSLPGGSFLVDGGEHFAAADCGAVLPVDVGEGDVVVAAACM